MGLYAVHPFLAGRSKRRTLISKPQLAGKRPDVCVSIMGSFHIGIPGRSAWRSKEIMVESIRFQAHRKQTLVYPRHLPDADPVALLCRHAFVGDVVA